MVDLHSHVLPLVDDGSSSLSLSLGMIRQVISQGVTDLVLTPHYRGVFGLTAKDLSKAFESFKKQVESEFPNLNLYLGQEIYVDGETKQMVLEKNLLTLNQTKYLLLEFNYVTESEIAETVYEFKRLGYLPIVAHVERYSYLTIDDVAEIKSVGGVIQINAESLVGMSAFSNKRKVVNLIKNNLVDVVAGDYHDGREYFMADAFRFIKRKFGEDKANQLFIENPKNIIRSQKI